MKKFIAGFFAGCVATSIGIIALGVFWTSPALDASAEIPDTVAIGTTFLMPVSAFNPHDQMVVLDNVDIPNEFFESFEVVSVSPTPTEESPIGGFGTQTWYFEIEVAPGATETAVFELRPIAKGRPVIEFTVCNSTEDCSAVVQAIEIQ